MQLRSLPVLLLCVAATGACRSYNERTDHALAAFESGRFDEARLAYAEDPEGKGFLPGVEGGMAALTAGRWQVALDYFTAAAEAVRATEEETLVSPEKAGETLLSWTVNETFSDYYGEGYERVMLHVCLGLAYLALGKVEDVQVEVRRANSLLENEEALYDADYGAGGMGHYLSAVTYELVGDYDDAYIDYKRLEAKGLGGALTGSALLRLASWLGRDDELGIWRSRYGEPRELPADAASVVLLAGVGLGPYKIEGRIDVPTSDGLISWAVPSSVSRPQPVSRLVLEAPSASVRSEVLEDVNRVARLNLEDRLAWLAAKSAVRAFLKYRLTDTLGDKHGEGARLLGAIFTAVTERADLRTWRTLPGSWQAARLFLEPGVHELTLTAIGGERIHLGSFELEGGETMFILARTLGRRVYAHPIGGRPVPAVPTAVQTQPQGEPQ